MLVEPSDSGPWHEELHMALAAMVDALGKHPSVAHLALSRILVSDAGLTIADRVLGFLRAGGFGAE